MDQANAGGKLTVIVLGSFAPSLTRFRGPLLAELAARGHRVIAMAPAIDSGLGEELRRIGAEPVSVPISNQSLNPLSMMRTLRALEQEFRRIRPDAVIAYTIKPVTLGLVAAARAGVSRTVALITGLGFAFTEGGGGKRRLSRLAAMYLYKRALRRSTSIIFQNDDDRADFEGLGLVPKDKKVTVVNGSGVDLEQFTPAPLPEAPLFLMIARLLGDKGTREYGEAAVRLKARYPHARFQLVGYFDQSPDRIREEELELWEAGGLEFLGKRDDVRPAIADAGVYVLPSYREGTPRSVLEAMAMGRAIVTTDAPGCRQTVDEGVNGFLVPPRDVQSLEAAMERFIRQPRLMAQMGAQSRRLAETRFDVHAVNDAVIAAARI